MAKPYIGEVARRDGGVKQYNRTIFLTPLLRNYRSFGLSPIFPYENTGEKVEYFLSNRQNHLIKECLKTPPLPCPATLQGVTYKIGIEAKEKYISPSSSVFCAAKYRGGGRRTEGLKNSDSNKIKYQSSPPVFLQGI